MQSRSVLWIMIVWVLTISMGLCASKRMRKLQHPSGPDNQAADEQRMRYPALDIEDTCKKSKNPKCEAVIDNFCIKSCSPQLCSEYGSIRGMCRLMCEAEDLPYQCLKMGSSKVPNQNNLFMPFQMYPNQQTYSFGQSLIQ